jgi:sulfatase maturation enzyme AslB (radical SAM superfamily)
MKTIEVLQAWGRTLIGRVPSLSIEITRECPLRCPGCYAYEENHIGGPLSLRQITDSKGDQLVERVLAVVDHYKPLHLSIVGGDPLVRYRELEVLVPQIVKRGTHVQVVTSAFRQIPLSWAGMEKVNVVVSIDGLRPEHDVRRAPATYERILKSIAGHRVTLHCTITGQMMKRPGYLEDFLRFWTPRPEVAKVWFSIFTPQVGDVAPEILTRRERQTAIQDMLALRIAYPKLDMPEGMVREFMSPPASPKDCIFAQTTETITADLKTKIKPCQFGGNPDCSQCGCVASMGLAAVGHHKVLGPITAGAIFRASAKIGNAFARLTNIDTDESRSTASEVA